jgi:hypothetical protein
MGFQIVVDPSDEVDPITKERILKDLPSLVIDNPWEFFIAGDIPALRFESNDPTLGDTREIWFIHDGNLYRISMYASHKEWLDAWVRQVAQDWTFSPPETELEM